METQSDNQIVEQLSSGDFRSSDAAAAKILDRGEEMIDPLLGLQGDTRAYAGWLGKRGGSMVVLAPKPGVVFTPQQLEKTVTLQVAALYLIEAIFRGRLDFASSALLTDLSLPPEERRAANKIDLIRRGFDAARAWSAELKREGMTALRARGENPLRSAGIAFW